jgi:tetratricopeptide (TPR) repeat protein
MQDGAFEDARKELEEALVGERLPVMQKVEACAAIAACFRYEKRFVEEMRAHDRAIQLDARNWMAHYAKGVAANRTGDGERLKEGEAALRRATEIDPKRAPAWCGLGANLALQKRPEEAIKAYSKGLELDTKSADAWAELGAVYESAGRNEQAADCWEAVLKLVKPGSDKAKAAEARLKALRGG